MCGPLTLRAKTPVIYGCGKWMSQCPIWNHNKNKARMAFHKVFWSLEGFTAGFRKRIVLIIEANGTHIR